MVALLGAVLGSIRAQDEPWYSLREDLASPGDEATSRGSDLSVSMPRSVAAQPL